MTASSLDLIATICFGLAVLHTFMVKIFQHAALKYPPGSVAENLFHLLGEIEVVFGIWAGVYLLFLTFFAGRANAIHYLESLNFTEPAFVFVIMVVCSTKPILNLANQVIGLLSKLIPLKGSVPFYFVTLTVGPLLGSFITEPAAMTVTALLLLDRLYSKDVSEKLKYATLGLLFVNISIGGTLTPYAAPPVLMVAAKWQWTLEFMLANFGWKAALAILISTFFVTARFHKELTNLPTNRKEHSEKTPFWVSLIHLALLVIIVASSHYLTVFVLLFLFFLGLTKVTSEYQNPMKIKEGLLVSFFLGGLVILGGPQRWWLEPILTQLSSVNLYVGAIGLTAITDNAALTYLGSQVPSISEASKYALVAGSVVGGGLTIIANAPNPAGYGILNSSFGEEGISPLSLFASALVPTGIAALFFWFG